MTHPDSVGTTNGAGTSPTSHAASTGGASTPAAAGPELELPVEAADERPAQPDALQQAREFLAAGEQAAALTALRALIAREPRHVRARAVLAEVLVSRNDIDGALLELGRALEISSDDVAVLCARAALLTARGRFDPAEADLRRAIRVAPASADVQLQLGVLFCKRARWREAIEPLRAAVESDPERVAPHYYLGEAYNSIDDLPAALSSFQTAAHLDPSHHRALKAIGVVLDRLKRPNDAAVAYQRAREAQRR
jgi:Tfp pilus assembly protein PilF